MNAADSKKKVLIMARQFIPYYSNVAGIIRILKLSEFLHARGFEVHILAAKGFEITYLGYEETLKKFGMHYVPDLLQYATSHIQKKRLRAGAAGGGSAPPGATVKGRLFSLAVDLLKEASVPDPGIFFLGRYVRAAGRIMRENGIRNVIVSSPPHSMQVAGWKLKQRFGSAMNFIVDYRDTWNTTRLFRKRFLLARLLSERLERKVLASADHFVYCTRPMLGKVSEKFFDLTDKALFVMNGFDEGQLADAPPAPAPRNECLTIGHFGSINDNETGFRNPSLFFEAVAESRQDIRIRLFGNAFISRHWQDRLGDRLKLCGTLPYAEAQKKMQDMDLLLLIHSEKLGAEEVVTGKFFEYLFAQRPILSVGPAGMEASNLVKENGLGYAADLYDPADLRDTLARIHRDRDNGALPCYDREQLMQFSRQHQYEKLLPILP